MSGKQPETYAEFLHQITHATKRLKQSMLDAARAGWTSGYYIDEESYVTGLVRGFLEQEYPSRVSIAVKDGDSWNPLAALYNEWISDMRKQASKGGNAGDFKQYADTLEGYIRDFGTRLKD